MADNVLMSEMSWTEVEQALKERPIALLPVGNTEAHGPHLPVSTDTVIAYPGCTQGRHSKETGAKGALLCTIEDGRVFALGAEGNLWCLEADSGKVLWSKDFVADFGAKTPFWGVAAHPLVEGVLPFQGMGELYLTMMATEGSSPYIARPQPPANVPNGLALTSV